MKNPRLCHALLLALTSLLIAGCGKPEPKRTNYEIHVYNSTPDTLSIEASGEIVSASRIKRMTEDEKQALPQMTATTRRSLGPNESTVVYLTQVRPFEIKVTSPAARTGLSHTFTGILPDTRKSLLLDLGASGRFYMAPVFYRTLPNSNRPIPPDFIAQHPPEALPGPQALYELDSRATRINAEPKRDVAIKRGSDFAVVYTLVDEAGLARAKRAAGQ